jgi:threonine dehydratase
VHVHIKLPKYEDAKRAEILQKKRNISSNVTKIEVFRNDTDGIIFLKHEHNLPLGSYKLRGVVNALEHFRQHHGKDPDRLIAVSAGNMAQAVASLGRELNIPVKAIVPDSAPIVKVEGIRALGGDVETLPIADVWELIENPVAYAHDLMFHPLFTPGILDGYGVIALEILEMPVRPDAVFIPFGVGGLALGITSILRQCAPEIAIVCVESEACPTLGSARCAGKPVYVHKERTCADAIGTPRVVEQCFEAIKTLGLHNCVETVTEYQIRSAVASLYLHYGVKVEGAAATSFAAALGTKFKRPLALLTGQNIDQIVFDEILASYQDQML